MSVITSLPATPNRIEMVYRYVRQCGASGVTPAELVEALSPVALRDSADSSAMAQDVVREASRLQIIALDSGRHYRLTPEVERWSDSSLVDWLESTLLDPDRAEAAGQAEFAWALAWLLEQDVAEPFEFGDNIRDLIEAQCGPEVQSFGITNRARLQNLVYWAQYLGYAWRLDTGKREVIMPDPTRAVERHLRRVLQPSIELPIGDLIRLWAERASVLEGGGIRLKMAGLCRKDAPRDTMHLSRSTSIALLRLEERSLVRLERRADALTYTLDSRPVLRPVSHLVWQEGR